MIINKLLIVPDSFKNSLSADEVAESLLEGFTFFKDKLEVESFPFADGGEGSLDVISRFIDCEERSQFTFDPFLKPIRATYLISHETKTAYIESAKVIGIEVLESKKPDCYNTSSYGLGILIKDALEQDVEEIYLFLGGSATCDGGIGMAAALGYDFVTEKRVIERPIAKDVKYLHEYRTANVHARLEQCTFQIAYDVENPLYGDEGTAYTYARQKGADDEQIELLELAMMNLGKMIGMQKHVDIQTIKGSGAAGGIGAGAYMFLNGTLRSAFEILSTISGLEAKIKSADIIITGEGHIDNQSFNGKLISQIKILADKYHKPVWLVSAIRSFSQKEVKRIGFEKIESIYRSAPKEINVPDTKRQLFRIAKKWASEIINNE